MPTFVGTPNHASSKLQSIGLALLVVTLVGFGALLLCGVWVSSGLSGLPRITSVLRLGQTLGFGVTLLPPLVAGIFALARQRSVGAKERVLDSELGRLEGRDHLVFCGRPWRGEAQIGDRSAYRLTDHAGRPVGSMSPDRTVLASSGVWLVIAGGQQGENGYSSGLLARQLTSELDDFLVASSDELARLPRSSRVRTLSLDESGSNLFDYSNNGSYPVGGLADLIHRAPKMLDATVRRELGSALLALYPAHEQTAGAAALGLPARQAPNRMSMLPGFLLTATGLLLLSVGLWLAVSWLDDGAAWTYGWPLLVALGAIALAIGVPWFAEAVEDSVQAR